MAKKEEATVVQIAKIKKKVVHVKLIGDSPLIMHAWSTKAKLMLLDAQQGKKKGKTKDFKNPVRDFIDSMYWISGKPDLPDNATEEQCEVAFNKAIADGARFGFPCTAFKQAGNSAAYRAGLVKNQMGLRAAYYIEPNDGEFIEIHGDTPIMREDMVRIGQGVADIRYRAEFRNWWCEFNVVYSEQFGYDLSSIISVIDMGGTACGIGEWRPEKDGAFGTYHVCAE